MKNGLIIILTILPVIIPGHLRALLGWDISFIIYSLCYLLIGYFFNYSQINLPRYILILIFFGIIFPISVLFSGREYWYPFLIPIYLFLAAMGFYAGFEAYKKKTLLAFFVSLILIFSIYEARANIRFIIYWGKENPVEYNSLIGMKPSLTFYDLNNNPIVKLDGKVVLLDFSFLECRTCIDKLKSYNSLAEYYKGRSDVVLVSVINGSVDSINNVRTFFNGRKDVFKVMYDKQGSFEKKYQIGKTGYPVELRLNKNGEICEIITSNVDPKLYLKNAIRLINSLL